MRRVSIFIALCFVLALGLTVMGQGQRDLDAIMKEIGPLWQTAGTGLQAKLNSPTPDFAAIAADAAKLQGLFTEAQAQFEKLKLAEPAGIAKGGADAAGALAKEAKTGKIADTKAAVTSIGVCKNCHPKYREPDGAGGFRLKAQ